MNVVDLEKYIQSSYGAEPEHLWFDAPNYTVFRHGDNKKWFAIIMDVPKNKLGLLGKEIVYIVNFKCLPLMIDAFCSQKGFFPAYHMSKTNWLTVALDGSVSDDTIKMLLDTSFKLTSAKARKRKLQDEFTLADKTNKN